jgi:3-phenylpropionate/trans-cinnamate dioxygenase ferredoxin reductase component
LAARSVDYLLIGGGLASGNCARWLREEGASGSILLVGREPDPPYNRPELSKSYMTGKESRDEVFFRPDDWWEEQEIELMTRTSVTGLDVNERVATLQSGDEVRFGQALLATGSNVRRLRFEGCQLDGIHYLRTFGNADAIRADAENAENVVLIGGSFIATEVAASLTSLGKRCAIVMQEEITLELPFGKEVGGFFHRLLESKGVDIHGGDEPLRFEGDTRRAGTGGERVRKVVTKAGAELDADMIVIGVGVTPDVTLAKAAGLETADTGVLVSSRLEASCPDVYAAGDIAEFDSVPLGRRLRVEHWDVAFNHGKTVAHNMLGRNINHEVIPYFYSDLADWSSMEYVGPGKGRPVFRGSMDEGNFTAFYLADDGVVTAALTVGRSDDLEAARRFIREKSAPDERALADPSTDLESL